MKHGGTQRRLNAPGLIENAPESILTILVESKEACRASGGPDSTQDVNNDRIVLQAVGVWELSRGDLIFKKALQFYKFYGRGNKI